MKLLRPLSRYDTREGIRMKPGVLVTALFLVWALSADVMYEQSVTTTAGDPGMKTDENIRVFIKGQAARMEKTVSSPRTGEQTYVTIYRFDRGVIWTLDMENMQYRETVPEDTLVRSRDRGAPETHSGMPAVTVKRTGITKAILNKTCEEVVVSVVEKSDPWRTELTMTEWVTLDLEGYEELRMFQRAREDIGVMRSAAVEILDYAAQARIREHWEGITGFPLESHDLLTMRRDGEEISLEIRSVITKIDKKPITQMVFEIPPGFTLKED